ncbi:unnamed protein product [Bursaphelenchus xylophilus]|uniref:(pine wood nematode) hypothetical protein n=1 Tax=Bursaphelenchus xylophilus TaxID=6326 RepID=A0A1I7SBU2_BURXY|nr:unnamed protein product [Bursaphelenchus xylophilus]CAG9113018.1 unnamed protein product [Bursaphelenchus xylophilus]
MGDEYEALGSFTDDPLPPPAPEKNPPKGPPGKGETVLNSPRERVETDLTHSPNGYENVGEDFYENSLRSPEDKSIISVKTPKSDNRLYVALFNRYTCSAKAMVGLIVGIGVLLSLTSASFLFLDYSTLLPDDIVYDLEYDI